MITVDDVVALIESARVQKIKFVAESVTLNGSGYAALIPKMRAGDLRIVASSAVTNNASHYTAWYNPTSNSIVVAQTNTLHSPNEKANMVHELCHAVVDNMNLPLSRGLSRTETEGIAYIAQQLFWHYSKYSNPHHWSHPLFRIADRIAKNIIRSRGLYTVSQDEIRALRDSIANDPAYRINPTTGRSTSIRGMHAQSDGI